jgi:hypothetical protein
MVKVVGNGTSLENWMIKRKASKTNDANRKSYPERKPKVSVPAGAEMKTIDVAEE